MWKKGKGFTLIELMVVIAIILILALIAIPAYRNMQDRAKRSRVQSDLRNLATALEMYNTDWTHYPNNSTSATRLLDKTGGTPSADGKELLGKGASVNVDTATTVTGEKGGIQYVEQLPIDPFAIASNQGGSYFYQSDGTKWILYSENSSVTPEEYYWRKSDGTTGTTTDTPPNL
ncbi:MAG TPA: prepilin-type N-terminal cleavage/methylation domain-containing protein [Caldisericia bacterium]|nr:prepilin-type N-terminal cleavage/methylation domain-containing protein [Caldisericia bacterium]